MVRSDWWFGQPLFRGTVNGESKCFQIERHGVGYRLMHRGVQADAVGARSRDRRSCGR